MSRRGFAKLTSSLLVKLGLLACVVAFASAAVVAAVPFHAGRQQCRSPLEEANYPDTEQGDSCAHAGTTRWNRAGAVMLLVLPAAVALELQHRRANRS